MSNFYIAFLVYLNLIFVAAKLWGRIEWSWYWIMAPMIGLTVIGLIASSAKRASRNKTKSNLIKNIQSLKDLIQSAKADNNKSDSRH